MNSMVSIWEGQVLPTTEVELTDAQLEAIFGAGDDCDDDEVSRVSINCHPIASIVEKKEINGAIKINFDHLKVKKDWALKTVLHKER